MSVEVLIVERLDERRGAIDEHRGRTSTRRAHAASTFASSSTASRPPPPFPHCHGFSGPHGSGWGVHPPDEYVRGPERAEARCVAKMTNK